MPDVNWTAPDSSGFEALGQQARVDARMRNETESYSDDQNAVLIRVLDEFRRTQTTPEGKPLPWSGVAEMLGISAPVLSEIRSGRYGKKGGDRDKYLRRIDDFLADARKRAGREDIRSFAEVAVTERVFGVFGAAIKHNSMAVLIGESGSGKTAHGRAFAATRSGVVFITVNEAFGDWRGVAAMLYSALGLKGDMVPRQRLAATIRYLSKNRHIVLVVDEAQKLRKSGLEAIRDIHDGSDGEGRLNTPIILLADHNFYQLIVRCRNEQASPVQPQLTRRLYPILDLSRDGSPDGSTGKTFSVDDIITILRNNRLRLVSAAGLRWLTSLANVRGYGSLGFALAVARMALDITQRRPLESEDLQRALRMMIGPRASEEADRSAGGELLRAAMAG